VAGVPPDYFSATGQLWGNPLYEWTAHRQTGYAWWIARLRVTLELVDLIRLDHFRGFEAAWEIPAGSPTAETGQWVKGPGAELFEVFLQAFRGLPLIAEDLGVITPEVEALRRHFGLPGMRILQFAFGGAREDRFLPHNYDANTVVYTGTHDNDTTLGWYRALTPAEFRFFRRYAPNTDGDPPWDLIRLAWASVADCAIAPLQDVLSLGTEARMNAPGQPRGNWRWRFTQAMLTEVVLDKLGELTEVYERSAGRDKP
jgi:4-alpha-glucanotransferase